MIHQLQSDALTVSVIPQLGGRIDSLIDQRTGKDWVWHPEGYEAPLGRVLPRDAAFDDHFLGGWEEVFPGDAKLSLNGLTYHDHGEMWREAWKVTNATDRSIDMQMHCSGVPVAATKSISLGQEGSNTVRVVYSFENRLDRQIPFLFKLHPALAIEAGDRVVMPECELEPVDLGFSRIARKQGRSQFPYVHGENGPEPIDRTRENDGHSREFLYAMNLREGRVGVESARTGSSLEFRYDTAKFPYTWMLQSFGGWNGMYVMLLEPSTTMPWDLQKAMENKSCAVLGPYERREFEVDIAIR